MLHPMLHRHMPPCHAVDRCHARQINCPVRPFVCLTTCQPKFGTPNHSHASRRSLAWASGIPPGIPICAFKSMGYACQLNGNTSLVSPAGRHPVLTDLFVVSFSSICCAIQTGNHDFNSITSNFNSEFARLRRRSSQADGFGVRYIEDHVPYTYPLDSITVAPAVIISLFLR